ncbi:TIGR04219 family outer membrane beta-barrel protein [Rheinheimera sp. MMS21-TC3]|uniref:TIGR04219 family outer membrane beta-barrel protein n=1 Tax=Rheinheimera sp. MMS21-TC3 TaxID=3072790 RepID=UPI0028C44460|nr:TIGR04219 family outer membrane beta-barrel protein [Rheinheimera sp. MMS21-TC3]WNO60510.1 TIGR04219 family outer membrane beta-barrel protein [Rheinheimera sp. MMS21-TC3]
MIKPVLALSIAGLLFSPAIKADTLLGLYIGADAWRTSTEGGFANTDKLQTLNFDDKTQASYYIALEHPIPVLPNARIQHTPLTANGSTGLSSNLSLNNTTFLQGTDIKNQVDLTSTDYILYYELFDNSLISLDLGVNAKYIKGDVYIKDTITGVAAGESVSKILPTAYAAATIGLPLTGLELFANGSYMTYDDNTIYDVQAGIAYALVDNIAIDVRLRAGYRAVNIKLDNVDSLYTDIDFNGAFVGLELHF